MRALLVAVGIGVAGCTSADPTPILADGGAGAGMPFDCGIPYLGSQSEDPVIEITAVGADGSSKPVADGDEVSLIFPPQGGRVVFVGVRAKNIDACGATLKGSLADPVTKQLRFDTRTVNLVPTGNGYGGSVDGQIASFSNIPVCPNQWASTDVYGHAFDLTVTLEERNTARKATKSIKVTPTCAEPTNVAACLCICKEGYTLGQMCDADGGASTP